MLLFFPFAFTFSIIIVFLLLFFFVFLISPTYPNFFHLINNAI